MIRLDDDVAVNPAQVTSILDWGGGAQTKVCFTSGHHVVVNAPFDSVFFLLSGKLSRA